MGKYLKQFETHQQYEAYTADTSNFITPNVSYCIDTPNEVHYSPYVVPDPYAGHEFVEIGGLKWATMNIGANSVTDTGLYFQWGDTQGYTAAQVGEGEGQKAFAWGDYKYNAVGSILTKYNNEDGLTILQPSDDAARANWGGSWRMPTASEWQDLGEATNSAWTTNYQGSGVSGFVLTDKTDSSKVLFLPAAGRCSNGDIILVNSRSIYWSSSLYTDEYTRALYMSAFSSNVFWGLHDERIVGCPVRGVVD